MELLLTDSEAIYFITLFKTAIENHTKTLSYGDSGKIQLVSFKDKRHFSLHYKYAEAKKVFHLLDDETKHTLFRVNLSNNFHKNADGTKIFGNRINIFSEEEFHDKNDGKTHYKCYPLPYECIENTDDFLRVFEQICDFSKIQKQDKINLLIGHQGTLF